MPRSMCVAWFSPSVRRSRITAHDASLEIVDSTPYFLNRPSSWAITIDAQSVSAIMPKRIFAVSGPSAAQGPPAQPAGRPLIRRPSELSPESFKNSRRASARGRLSFFFRMVSFLHREAVALGGETENLRLELGVRRAGAGLDVELVAVQRADRLVALEPARRELPAFVLAAVLERAEPASMIEHGDLVVFHADELGRAFRDLPGPDHRRRRLLLARGFGGRRRLGNSPELLAHRLEGAVARQPGEDVGEIAARHVFHDLDRRVGLRPGGAADKNVRRFDDLAVHFDVFSQ